MNKSDSKNDLAGSSSTSEKRSHKSSQANLETSGSAKKKKSSSDLQVTAIEDLKSHKHHHHHHKDKHHHKHKRDHSRDDDDEPAPAKTPRGPDPSEEWEPDDEFPLVIVLHLADQDASFCLRFLELKAPLEELKHKVEGVLDARRLKSAREEVSLVMPTKQGYLPLINQKQLNDLIHENISGVSCKVRITVKLHKPQNFVNIPTKVANMMEAHEVMIALERPCFVVDGTQFTVIGQNALVEVTLGYTLPKVVNKKFDETVILPAPEFSVRENVKKLTSDVTHVEWSAALVKVDGSFLRFKLSASPMLVDTQPCYLISLLPDK